MTLRQMLEATTLISAHSSSLIELGQTLPQDALHRYWSCSRARLRIWTNRFDACTRESASCGADERSAQWEKTESLFNEVFVTELVTRVWGAILTACDRRQMLCDAELIARNVLLGHQEVRQKALRIMLNGPHITLDQIAQVDCLRRRVERWTDLLLGHLVIQYGMHDFAFDAARSFDFGTTQLAQPRGPRRDQVWQLYLLCLTGGFADISRPHPLHEKFRAEIIKTMLACFPAELFSEEGPLKSTWFRLVTQPTIQERPPRPGEQQRLRPSTPAQPAKLAAPTPMPTPFPKLRRKKKK